MSGEQAECVCVYVVVGVGGAHAPPPPLRLIIINEVPLEGPSILRVRGRRSVGDVGRSNARCRRSPQARGRPLAFILSGFNERARPRSRSDTPILRREYSHGSGSGLWLAVIFTSGEEGLVVMLTLWKQCGTDAGWLMAFTENSVICCCLDLSVRLA